MLNSIEVKSNKPNKFIARIYQIIDESRFSNIIYWTETGYSFAISSAPLFTSRVIPAYFKHKNFSSFIRQLNMYGFHKERDTGDIQVYSHPNFIKEHPERLSEVRRKLAKTEEDSLNRSKPDDKIKHMSSKQKLLQEKIKKLEGTCKEVKETNKTLLLQISECLKREQKLENLLSLCLQQPQNFSELQQNYNLSLIRSFTYETNQEAFFNALSMFNQK